jgi:hypothetical protein
MRVRRQVHKVMEEVVDIFCNKCGVSCKLLELGGKSYFGGITEIEVTGGYSSTHLEDGDVYQFSLCEQCVLELIKTFKLSAKRGNYLFPEDAHPEFDRHPYWPEGTKFWEDLTDEEAKAIKEGLNSRDWIKECPRDELIVWLYDLERDPKKDQSLVEEIKQVLAEKDSRCAQSQ